MHLAFYGLEDDLRALLKLAASQALVVLPASHAVDETPAPADPVHFAVDEQAFLLLPREYTLDDVVYVEGTKGKAGRAAVDLEASPVILFSPSVLWGAKLDVGSLDMGDSPADRRFSLTERKYGVLTNAIRRWHRTDKNQGFVGPQAEKAVREHRVQLGLGKKAVTLW